MEEKEEREAGQRKKVREERREAEKEGREERRDYMNITFLNSSTAAQKSLIPLIFIPKFTTEYWNLLLLFVNTRLKNFAFAWCLCKKIESLSQNCSNALLYLI